jgi:hypothetical protein
MKGKILVGSLVVLSPVLDLSGPVGAQSAPPTGGAPSQPTQIPTNPRPVTGETLGGTHGRPLKAAPPARSVARPVSPQLHSAQQRYEREVALQAGAAVQGGKE